MRLNVRAMFGKDKSSGVRPTGLCSDLLATDTSAIMGVLSLSRRLSPDVGDVVLSGRYDMLRPRGEC